MASLLLGLGRSCPVEGVPLSAGEAEGWTVRYEFSTNTPSGNDLARWLTHRSWPGQVRGEVRGPVSEHWQTLLQKAGWNVQPVEPDSTTPREPQLSLINPQGEATWVGVLRAKELSVANASVLDLPLLARVIRHQPAPRAVPIGCALETGVRLN